MAMSGGIFRNARLVRSRPATAEEDRIWIGPRLLVRVGENEGFVADEIPSNRLGCPIAWREWLQDDNMHLSANTWTAQWMGELRQFKPIVKLGRRIRAVLVGDELRAGSS